MARHAAALAAPETAILPAVKLDIRESPVLPGTMGYAALAYLDYATASEDNAYYFQREGTLDDARVAMEQMRGAQERTYTLIEDARHRIGDAPRQQRVEKYLYEAFGTQFRQARKAGAQHATVREWLTDERQGASNAQLLDFIEQHVEYIKSRQQSPEFIAQVEKARGKYIETVEQAIDKGLYVPEAAESLEKVKRARVLVGDVWDTTIMDGALGFYNHGTDYIVVSQHFDPHRQDGAEEENLETTLLHELDHLQFLDSIQKEGLPLTFIEFAAEHAALAMNDGYWHEVNPYLRPGERGVYPQERLLQDTITTDGRRAVNPLLAIRAHSAPAGHPAWQKYYDELAKSSRPDIHHWAEQRRAQYQSELMSRGVSRHEANDHAIRRVRIEFKRGEYAAASRARTRNGRTLSLRPFILGKK